MFGCLLAQGIKGPRQARLVLEQLARVEDVPVWITDALEGMDTFENGS
jgi:hypothetical protein